MSCLDEFLSRMSVKFHCACDQITAGKVELNAKVMKSNQERLALIKSYREALLVKYKDTQDRMFECFSQCVGLPKKKLMSMSLREAREEFRLPSDILAAIEIRQNLDGSQHLQSFDFRQCWARIERRKQCYDRIKYKLTKSDQETTAGSVKDTNETMSWMSETDMSDDASTFSITSSPGMRDSWSLAYSNSPDRKWSISSLDQSPFTFDLDSSIMEYGTASEMDDFDMEDDGEKNLLEKAFQEECEAEGKTHVPIALAAAAAETELIEQAKETSVQSYVVKAKYRGKIVNISGPVSDCTFNNIRKKIHAKLKLKNRVVLRCANKTLTMDNFESILNSADVNNKAYRLVIEITSKGH